MAGPSVRDACARHLRDLELGPARGLLWDPAAADRAIRFFETVLYLTDLDEKPVPFRLQPFQKFIIGSIFGWKIAATGFRRFRTFYYETAKGNGKSPLDAGIALYMMVADGEPRANIFSAGSNKDQARVVFDEAVTMVTSSPVLKNRVELNGQKPVWQLTYVANGKGDSRFFKPISQEGGKSGPRVHCAVAGELHEWQDDYVLRMLRFGFKNRRQPLLIMETNSGTDENSVCGEQHAYAVKVAGGHIEDDAFFSFVCGLDPEDIKDDAWMARPEVWPKANPGLGAIIQPSYIEGLIREARGMPARRSEVARLNMCVWRAGDESWIEPELWDAGEVEFEPDDLIGLPCWLSLDLSGSRDLTVLGATWEDDGRFEEPGTLWSAQWFWMPKDDLPQREDEDSAPYRQWVVEGHIEAIDGLSIDPDFVAVRVGELKAKHDVRGLAYDPWRIKDFQRALRANSVKAWIYEGPNEPAGEGLMLVGHGQGSTTGAKSDHLLWMPRSIEATEKAVVENRFRWRANPVLKWCSGNATHGRDGKKNRFWKKITPRGRIDGIVTACMGVGLAEAKPVALVKSKVSPYEHRGLVVVGQGVFSPAKAEVKIG